MKSSKKYLLNGQQESAFFAKNLNKLQRDYNELEDYLIEERTFNVKNANSEMNIEKLSYLFQYRTSSVSIACRKKERKPYNWILLFDK